MPQNFLDCDRDQSLLPPDMREWLAEDHFAWFVIEAVEALDLADFFADYRDDGHCRAAHDPQMMVALTLYAYAIGERSSRMIERRCREDVAFRVIAANRTPDHATIAHIAPDADSRKDPRPRPTRRPLRLHEIGAQLGAGIGSLFTETMDDRARLRGHQVQPALRALQTTRAGSRSLRMAPPDRHPQPPEAPSAPAGSPTWMRGRPSGPSFGDFD